MKKLFFTAIALVAFSGVSMARNVVEKEISDDSIKFVVEGNSEAFCARKAALFLDFIDPNNELSAIDASAYYRGYVDACMGNPPR